MIGANMGLTMRLLGWLAARVDVKVGVAFCREPAAARLWRNGVEAKSRIRIVAWGCSRTSTSWHDEPGAVPRNSLADTHTNSGLYTGLRPGSKGIGDSAESF